MKLVHSNVPSIHIDIQGMKQVEIVKVNHVTLHEPTAGRQEGTAILCHWGYLLCEGILCSQLRDLVLPDFRKKVEDLSRTNFSSTFNLIMLLLMMS